MKLDIPDDVAPHVPSFVIVFSAIATAMRNAAVLAARDADLAMLPGTPTTSADWPRLIGNVVFQDTADYTAWLHRVADRDKNLAEPSNHGDLLQGTFDIRTIANDDKSVRFFGAFYNEFVQRTLVSPIAVAQKLSHFMANFGESATCPEFPTTATWTAADVMNIRSGAWDFNYSGPLRAVLSKARGFTDGFTL